MQIKEAVCTLKRILPCSRTMMLHAKSKIMMTAVKNDSFAECVLGEISGACVDTKPCGIEATCIVSSDRG